MLRKGGREKTRKRQTRLAVIPWLPFYNLDHLPDMTTRPRCEPSFPHGGGKGGRRGDLGEEGKGKEEREGWNEEDTFSQVVYAFAPPGRLFNPIFALEATAASPSSGSGGRERALRGRHGTVHRRRRPRESKQEHSIVSNAPVAFSPPPPGRSQIPQLMGASTGGDGDGGGGGEGRLNMERAQYT